MASYSVNDAARRAGRELIDAPPVRPGQRLGRGRSRARTAQNAYLESHSWEDYARLAPRPHRGRERRDQGALRVRLRRLPPRAPHRPDRLRLPRRRVAPQGRRARGSRPAAAPRPKSAAEPDRRGAGRNDRHPRASGPLRAYGAVVDSVNVSVLAYAPVRSASVAAIACRNESVTASLLTGPRVGEQRQRGAVVLSGAKAAPVPAASRRGLERLRERERPVDQPPGRGGARVGDRQRRVAGGRDHVRASWSRCRSRRRPARRRRSAPAHRASATASPPRCRRRRRPWRSEDAAGRVGRVPGGDVDAVEQVLQEGRLGERWSVWPSAV